MGHGAEGLSSGVRASTTLAALQLITRPINFHNLDSIIAKFPVRGTPLIHPMKYVVM